ncbi:MAG: hypothetical protein O9294_18380 [Cytophagales bacterium]|jgi:hypothetical protein|nr:hypothetical protein [Cytophagales bacterium]
MILVDYKELTFRQYFILNKSTSIYCLKICSVIFGVIASLITIGLELKTGNKENPWTVFIICEIFGYGHAIFIFALAILQGYSKARLTINQFNKMDDYLKQQYSIELIRKPLNPKHWFMQFDIVRKDGDEYYPIDEELKQRLIR